ncbi:MAG TPA: hypothetical protein VGC79_32045 [Polyangiaceae bacterium]
MLRAQLRRLHIRLDVTTERGERRSLVVSHRARDGAQRGLLATLCASICSTKGLELVDEAPEPESVRVGSPNTLPVVVPVPSESSDTAPPLPVNSCVGCNAAPAKWLVGTTNPAPLCDACRALLVEGNIAPPMEHEADAAPPQAQPEAPATPNADAAPVTAPDAAPVELPPRDPNEDPDTAPAKRA